MPFTEICIYQVKPQKVDEFETLMSEAKAFLGKAAGAAFASVCEKRVPYRHGAD